MVVEKGYKQTEVGVIPEDWDVVQIGDIVNSTQLGGNYQNTDKENDFPLIKMGNINRGKIIVEKLQYITIPKPNERDKLNRGDVLFNTRNTLELVGKIGIWRDELDSAYFNSNLMRFVFNEKIKSNFWVNYILNTPNFISQLRNIAIGTTSVAAIYNRDLFKLTIPLPSLHEQTAIANALSDMDALIAQTEKLIEKKKAIKQGVMQELLKPKAGWVTKKLGEVVEKITTGKLDANAMKPDGDYRFYTCAKEYYFIDKYAFDDEALLISGNGANVGYIHYYKGKFNAYQRTYVLTGFEINIAFIKIYLDKYLSDRIATEVSAGNTPYIKMDTISEMNICYPDRTEEQESIASIINDLTRGFDKLETKLQKLKLQKQGMMQALLTGKIRLI